METEVKGKWFPLPNNDFFNWLRHALYKTRHHYISLYRMAIRHSTTYGKPAMQRKTWKKKILTAQWHCVQNRFELPAADGSMQTVQHSSYVWCISLCICQDPVFCGAQIRAFIVMALKILIRMFFPLPQGYSCFHATVFCTKAREEMVFPWCVVVSL